MDEPQEPRTEDELPFPFERIGEPGWDERARGILTAFGVPLPEVVSADELASTESRLGVKLPAPYRQLLLEIGPLDLDGIRFLPLAQVNWLTDFWAKAAFRPEDAAQLSGLLGIVEYLGTDDFIALNPATGECARCGHDPPGLSKPLPSVDALVQYGFMHLPAGYYGWPGQHVDELVYGALRSRFGVIF